MLTFFFLTGPREVSERDWEIYFCSIRIVQWDTLVEGPEVGEELGDCGIEVYHVDGCLHKLVPLNNFQGFRPNETIVMPFTAGDWCVSRTDIMPK